MLRRLTIFFLLIIFGLGAIQLLFKNKTNLMELARQSFRKKTPAVTESAKPVRRVDETTPPREIVNPNAPIWAADTTKQRRLVLLHQLGEKKAAGQIQFRQVADLEFDSRGNLYVLDFGNKRIEVFDPQGQHIRTVGVGKNREILLSKPTDVALHPDGRVYVSDLWKGILVFNPNGTLINTFRIEYEITATVFDSKGNLVAVTPSDTYLLHTFTARGQEVTAFGLQQETSEALREAFGQGFLAIDKTDNVYLSYAFPYKIAKYNPEGQAVLTFARELETPLTPPTIYKGKDGNITQVFRQQFSYDVDVGGDGLIYNLIRTRGAKGGNLIDIFSSTGEYLQTLYLISNAEKFCLYADKIALLTASRFPSIEIYQIQAIRR